MRAMSWIVVFMMSLAIVCSAQSYKPVANLTEKWTNSTSGWVVSGYGSVNVVSQSLALSFSNLVIFSPYTGAMMANSNASAGLYIGNYSNSAITTASFDVIRSGFSTNAQIIVGSTNTHAWVWNFALPASNGVWEHRDIPMTYSTNWTRGGATGTVALFEADRSCVSDVSISVTREGEAIQRVQIDNFKFVGPWEKGPFWADGVPKYWLVENGLTNQEGMATNDWDNDGFNNFGEYMAGTDPKGSNSLLKVTINKVASSNAVTLSWPRADYRTYKVLLNTNLTVSSYQQYTGSTYQAVGATNQMTIGSLSNGPNFFKVEVDK